MKCYYRLLACRIYLQALCVALVLVLFPDKIHATDVKFKLVGGGDTYGLVSIDGPFFAPVCVEEFNRTMAQILCRSLGLNSSKALNTYPYRYSPQNITQGVWIELSCSQRDSESHCTFQLTGKRCLVCPTCTLPSSMLAGVLCTNEAPQYRLADVKHDSIGRLEIKVNGGWGPVCAESARNEGRTNVPFLQVACRSLGLPSEDARHYIGLYKDARLSPVLSQIRCTGNESRIEDCTYNSWGKPCGNNNFLGLSCANAHEGKLRLLGGHTGIMEGYLNVYHKNRWLDVSTSSTDPNKEAKVVCRSLNLTTENVRFMKGSSKSYLWLDDVECTGNENNLFECNNTSLDDAENPVRGYPLGIMCDEGDEAMELESDGLLKVRHNGVWGTVCAKGFANFEASVICKSFNKSSSLSSRTIRANSPVRTGPIWDLRLKCNQTAKTWKDCDHGRWRDGDCSHLFDAYISCKDLDRSSVKYQLSSGPLPYVGIAQISLDNVWGTICVYGISDQEARVFCRSLGKRVDGARVISSAHLPSDKSKIWLGDVKCDGNERSLLDCNHSYPGDHRCHFRNDFAVYCGAPTKTDDFTLRLVGGSHSSTGRLEMMMYGEWGTVCGVNFTAINAMVACRELGLPHLEPRVLKSVDDHGDSSQRIRVTGLQCTGFEQSLRQCRISFEQRSGCDHSHDVGIFCTDSSSGIKPDWILLGAFHTLLALFCSALN